MRLPLLPALLRVAVAVCGLALPDGAVALEHLKLVIPAARGSDWDLRARDFGSAMLAAGSVRRLSFDNRRDAGDAAANFARESKGDPLVLLVAGPATIGAALRGGAAIGPAQLTPIARLTAEFPVVLVGADSPLRNMVELMARFRSDPGAISWGSGEAGGIANLLVSQLAREAEVPSAKVSLAPLGAAGNAVAVTGAQLQAYVSGTVSGQGASASILDRTLASRAPGTRFFVAIANYPAVLASVRSHRLRALAIASEAKRDGIPTLKEQGLNIVLPDWLGFFAAPGVSKEGEAALAAAVADGAKHATWRQSLRQRNWSPSWLPGPEFGRFVAAETRQIGQTLGAERSGQR